MARKNAHIHAARLRRAYTLQFSGLQHAQQLGLLAHRHVGDLVQKERAAVGQLEAADAVGARVGECALHVAEDFALEGALRQPAGVHGHQRHARSRRSGMQQLGHNLLARTVFAGDEDVGVGRADLRNQFQHRLHGRRAGDKLRHAVGAQQAVLQFQLARAAQGLMQLGVHADQAESRRSFSHGF